MFVHHPSKDVQLFVNIGTKYRCHRTKKNRESGRTHVVQHLHEPQRTLVSSVTFSTQHIKRYDRHRDT